MGQVIASASMSLDGYIAKDDNTIGRLFDWLQNGAVAIPTVNDDITFHLSPPSAEYWRQWLAGLGALVCGRTLFDVTGGWGGRHTMDIPVVVVTHEIPTDWAKAHPEAPFHFVTDGVAAAVARAQAIAGERTVAVTAGTIALAVPGARPARRGRRRPGARGHGRGPSVLREAVGGRRHAGRPDGLHPGGSRHPPRVPRDRAAEWWTRVRTLHVGLRVEDLERSLGFYTRLRYEVVGTVPETGFGSLAMLKLPDDEFVSVELVHDPTAGTVHPRGLNHLVIRVDDLHGTVARLTAAGIQADAPSSPNGSEDFLTTWLTDPDGYRIELVQWPIGHADGLSRADFPGQGSPSATAFHESQS